MNVLVFSEDNETAFQLLRKARDLSASITKVYVLCDRDTEDYLRYGANVVIKADLNNNNVEGCRDALVKAMELSEPEVILIGATKFGKELAPRVAAKIGAGCITDCTNIYIKENKIVTERYTYGGSTISYEQGTGTPTIVTVPPRTFEKMELGEVYGEIVELVYETSEPRIKVIERRDKQKSEADLENADIIISAGRGFKEKEDIKILEELSKVLGAQMGCSRPISADLGWMDDWVGISGRKVKPSLYIACGISGTIQHIAGIRDSKIIVAINKEEGAGIHKISDYSIIGDIYEVLPALVKVLKEKV
jgi:electron transfer flavoprotein alpha subunit